MSVNNVEKIQVALDSLAAMKSRLEGAQANAKETLLRSLDGFSDKIVEECTAGVAETSGAVAQAQTQVSEMLQQADALIVEAGKSTDPAIVDSLTNLAAQTAAQAQQALAQASEYVGEVESWTKQAQEIAEHSSHGGEAFGWTEMLLMAGIGFGIVFAVLILLIFIMKGMGWIFTRQKKAAKVAKAAPGTQVADDEHEAISDQEIAAAIMTALKLYKSNLHDRESEMLTIHRITRAYSPWSSKIHGLTQLPERK